MSKKKVKQMFRFKLGKRCLSKIRCLGDGRVLRPRQPKAKKCQTKSKSCEMPREYFCSSDKSPLMHSTTMFNVLETLHDSMG
jgi:hypothetical protein